MKKMSFGIPICISMNVNINRRSCIGLGLRIGGSIKCVSLLL